MQRVGRGHAGLVVLLLLLPPSLLSMNASLEAWRQSAVVIDASVVIVIGQSLLYQQFLRTQKAHEKWWWRSTESWWVMLTRKTKGVQILREMEPNEKLSNWWASKHLLQRGQMPSCVVWWGIRITALSSNCCFCCLLLGGINCLGKKC